MSGTEFGDLITDSRLIAERDLMRALGDLERTGLPIGLQLIVNRAISFVDLRCVLSAQSLVRDGLVSRDSALSALTMCKRKKVSLSVALDLLGLDVSHSLRNRLGAILLDSEVVDRSDMRQSLDICNQVGLPLGRVLVAAGKLDVALLNKGLQLQKLIRADEVQRQSAVDQLAALKSFLDSITQVGSLPTDDRLGALLLSADLLERSEIDDALKLSKLADIPIGESLLELSAVSEPSINVALVIQKLIRSRKVSFRSGVDLLRRAHQIDSPLAVGSEDGTRCEVSFSQFLRLVQIYPTGEKGRNEQSADASLDITWQQLPIQCCTPRTKLELAPDIIESLKANGFDSTQLQLSVAVAARQYKLLRHGAITLDQALVSFHLGREAAAGTIDCSDTFPALAVWIPPNAES